ncbi:MAG: hypothetical protein K0B02_05090 [DPANN group archaeon]|nr:hypothetical protein [DPANN group archaeon]
MQDNPLNIEICDELSTQDLISGIKNTPLLFNSEICPYKEANVSIKKFHTDELSPTAFYVLEDRIKMQDILHKTLINEFDINSYCLEKGYVIDDGTFTYTLLPVITHRSDIDGGVILVEDGAHRSYHARSIGSDINTIFIEGVPEHIPFYAFPNPNGWGDVNVFDDISNVTQKKLYRTEDKDAQYKLFRDYDAVFPGIGTVRKK